MPAKRRRFDSSKHATICVLVPARSKVAFQRLCARREDTMSGYLARAVEAALLAQKIRRGAR